MERQEKDHCNGPRGDNGAQDQGESSGGGERWADTSSILKVESINLDIGLKEKVKVMIPKFGLSNFVSLRSTDGLLSTQPWGRQD